MQEEMITTEQKPKRKGFAKLKHDLKGMTFKEKAEHLWTYYRWVIIVAFMSLLLISLLVSTYVNAHTNLLVGGIGLNLGVDDTAKQALTEGFQKQHGNAALRWEDAEFVDVSLRSGPNTDVNDAEQRQYNMVNIHAMYAGQDLDYIISDEEGIYALWPDKEENRPYMDLRKFFTEEQIAAFGKEGRLLIYGNGESAKDGALREEDQVIGVDISGLPLVKEHFSTKEKVYFCVVKNSPRMDALHTFWEYINAWK